MAKKTETGAHAPTVTRGAWVYDIGVPARLGVVKAMGAEVSEVEWKRWKHKSGREYGVDRAFVANAHLRPAAAKAAQAVQAAEEQAKAETAVVAQAKADARKARRAARAARANGGKAPTLPRGKPNGQGQAKARGKRKGNPAAAYAPAAIIHMLVRHNIRRKGSPKAARFAVLLAHHGQTWATYLAAGGNPVTAINAVKEGVTEMKE